MAYTGSLDIFPCVVSRDETVLHNSVAFPNLTSLSNVRLLCVDVWYFVTQIQERNRRRRKEKTETNIINDSLINSRSLNRNNACILNFKGKQI